MGGRLFISDIGICGFLLLLVILQGMHSSHFCWISLTIFGYQNKIATDVILMIAEWPLRSRITTVLLRFPGTVILSSENTMMVVYLAMVCKSIENFCSV